MAEAQVVENKKRGLLFASLMVPVAVAAWVLLWQQGFIASLVAFGLAYGVVWLYAYGAGAEPSRAATPWLIGLIVGGVILSYLSGMASDAWYAYTHELEGKEGFFSADFWDMFLANLFTVELWEQYITDLLISVAFAALGSAGIIKELMVGDKPAPEPAKA